MKTHIYCVPGLAANSKIFEYIQLPEDKYEIHFIEWIIPESIDETLQHYAKRMCKTITEKKVILMGVSFGGVMVQEMSKIINPLKTIIVSSVKNVDELSNRLKIIKLTKAYKLFPANSITPFEDFVSSIFGGMTKKRVEKYKIYLSVRNPLYLKWAIENVLHWNQKETLPNIIHIHGTADHIFSIKHIKNAIKIDNGAHIMILNKAKKINEILVKELAK